MSAPTNDTKDLRALVDAEVIAGGGISYFTREPVYAPDGSVALDPNGNEIYSNIRREARFRDIVQITPFEFQRQAQYGAVQEPGSAPLVGDAGWRPKPTPFGMPMPDENGNLYYPEGPIMGEPSPSADGTTDAAMTGGGPGSGRPLTAEEAAALEAKARGETPEDDAELQDSMQAYLDTHSKEELKDEASTREGLEVTRSDGKEGEPTKEDYARALAEDDRE